MATRIDLVRIDIIFIDKHRIGNLAPPVGLNLLMSSYRFHKAVALLRATLPVISALSVAVLPTISIPELTTALPHWLRR